MGFCVDMCLHFVWAYYLAVKLRGLMVPVFGLFEELRTGYQRNCSIFHSHPQRTTVLVSPHHLQYFLSVFLKLAILVVGKWCLIVVWICISLRILGVFPCAAWPFVYLFWRNVCASPLPLIWKNENYMSYCTEPAMVMIARGSCRTLVLFRAICRVRD